MSADNWPDVLIVEDEEAFIEALEVGLRREKFRVRVARDGSSALEMFSEAPPEIVLLDVMLPDMGGLEVAERLAADSRTRDVPVVFLSARASVEDLRRGYEQGAVDYITKPFDPVELADRVREIVGRVERGESERFRAERLAELED